MKRQVFGRKAGSQVSMTLLLESDGVCDSGRKVDPALVQFALTSTLRQVRMLRDKNIEGYVVFENDPTRYEFSPEADFVYPGAVLDADGN